MINSKDMHIISELSVKLKKLVEARETLADNTISTISIGFKGTKEQIYLTRDQIIEFDTIEDLLVDIIDKRSVDVQHALQNMLNIV